jgi:hypothetical protein
MNYVDVANVDRFLDRVKEMNLFSGRSASRSLENMIEMFGAMDLSKDRDVLRRALQGEEVEAPPAMTMKEFKRQWTKEGEENRERWYM